MLATTLLPTAFAIRAIAVGLAEGHERGLLVLGGDRRVSAGPVSKSTTTLVSAAAGAAKTSTPVTTTAPSGSGDRLAATIPAPSAQMVLTR